MINKFAQGSEEDLEFMFSEDIGFLPILNYLMFKNDFEFEFEEKVLLFYGKVCGDSVKFRDIIVQRTDVISTLYELTTKSKLKK
jgi:hypothetical protein